MTAAADHTPAGTPQRPDECPDVASHARPRRQGDYRSQRTYRCPSCGFWCLLAPAQAALPVIQDEPDIEVLYCADCGNDILAGQSCRCSEPTAEAADTDPPLSWDPGDPGWAPTQVAS